MNFNIDEFRMIIGQQELEKFDLHRKNLQLQTLIENLNKQISDATNTIIRLEEALNKELDENHKHYGQLESPNSNI